VAFLAAAALVLGLRQLAYSAWIWVVGSEMRLARKLMTLAAPAVLVLGLMVQLAWAAYLVWLVARAVSWVASA
jgi:hypothetical protein